MKQLYILALLLATSFFSNDILAQCEGVTLESLTNPGPYEVATLTEADGIRNGPDYQGATIYYPSNATPPFASIAMVPGFTAMPSSIKNGGPFMPLMELLQLLLEPIQFLIFLKQEL